MFVSFLYRDKLNLTIFFEARALRQKILFFSCFYIVYVALSVYIYEYLPIYRIYLSSGVQALQEPAPQLDANSRGGAGGSSHRRPRNWTFPR